MRLNAWTTVSHWTNFREIWHLNYLLTPCSRSLLDKHFTEPEGSQLCLQVPASCPDSETDHWSPCSLYSNYWRSILILSSQLCLGLPSGFLPTGFTTRTLYTPLLSFVRATCLAHLILGDFITQIIFGAEYRSLNPSLCSFLNYPVTSALLGPNIFLSTLFSNTLSLRSSLKVKDHVSHP